MACAPEAGTRVLVRDDDYDGSTGKRLSIEVTVMEGPFAGCRGRIPALFYRAE